MKFSERRTQSILKEKTGNEALLTLDGGGIRGLVLTEILFALESITGQCIYNLFDWVSGTSTGSFLAMSAANGKMICQHSYNNKYFIVGTFRWKKILRVRIFLLLHRKFLILRKCSYFIQLRN